MVLFLRFVSFIARLYHEIIFFRNRKFVYDNFSGKNLPNFNKEILLFKSKVYADFQSLDGISFVYRLKNADKFLALSVSSILPLAREIIFVDNGSTDETKYLINKIVSEFSSMVVFKVFEYNEFVCQQGAGYSACLRKNPKASLADFYNFCFDKASSPYVFKIDAHKVLLPDCIENIKRCLKSKHPILFLRGIDFFGRKIYYEPLLYRRNDFSYVDGDNFEYLNLKSIARSDFYRYRFNGFGFLHLKNFAS